MLVTFEWISRAQVARSLVSVAGGATRAALIQHQARRDKSGRRVRERRASQETLVNLAALLSNLLILPSFATNNLYSLSENIFFCILDQ